MTQRVAEEIHILGLVEKTSLVTLDDRHVFNRILIHLLLVLIASHDRFVEERVFLLCGRTRASARLLLLLLLMRWELIHTITKTT